MRRWPLSSGPFARGRKIKSPLQLLQVVMLYCGVDLSLRGTAGMVTLLAEGISYRLHLAIDLLTLELVRDEVSDAHTGESLDHFPFQEGMVAWNQ